MMFRLTNALALLGLFAALQHSALSASTPQVCVRLSWNPSPTVDIAGYRLYQGGKSQTYTNMIEVANVTIATMPGLTPGATYFFAATAVGLDGLESPFSDEIKYTVPPTAALAKLSVSMLSNKQARLSGTGPIGYQYQVLASKNCTSWTAIGSVTNDANGSFQFTDTGAVTNALRSYRLRQTSP